jgi:DNA-binding MarR family transcriptional regulator
LTSKDAVIAKIVEDQRRMQIAFARDRSNPFFSVHLTMSQLKILFALRLHGPAGGQELAQTMGVSLATITGIIDRLVASGHVTRGEDPRDRRVRRIELTDKGTGQVDEMIVAGERHQRRVLERLTVKELQVVADAMEIMHRALAEEGMVQSAGHDPV